MVELSKIEFQMAVAAMKASELASSEEEKYNLKRSTTVLEEKARNKSITEATEIWKFVAETEYGWYRSMKEKAKWMWQLIDTIRWFKIAVYSSEKENDEATNSNFSYLNK